MVVAVQVIRPAVWLLAGLAGGVATDRSRCLAVALGSRLRVVGLTGGIACGKSAAVQRMRELNVPVVDADAIAHQVLRKGTATHARVVATFAKYPGVVGADGDIDRAALRSLVFGDRALNRVLKQCTHRAIALEMVRQLLTHSLLRRAPLVVLDAPLLFESRADLLCKQTICVHCPEALQLRRLAARDGGSEEECRKAVAAQMPAAEKLRRAGLPLANGGTLSELRTKVDGVVAGLRAEASAHPLAPLLARS